MKKHEVNPLWIIHPPIEARWNKKDQLSYFTFVAYDTFYVGIPSLENTYCIDLSKRLILDKSSEKALYRKQFSSRSKILFSDILEKFQVSRVPNIHFFGNNFGGGIAECLAVFFSNFHKETFFTGFNVPGIMISMNKEDKKKVSHFKNYYYGWEYMKYKFSVYHNPGMILRFQKPMKRKHPFHSWTTDKKVNNFLPYFRNY